MNSGKLKILSGSANPKLAKDVCSNINCCDGLVDSLVAKFNDEESRIEIYEDIAGTDLFIIQPTCRPVNHNIIELCLLIDAAKRAACRRITVVIPYFGYARQDKAINKQDPISARAIAKLLEAAGADRFITIDIHSPQTLGFFSNPIRNLYASDVFLEIIRNKYTPEEIVMISPDTGGAERCKAYAKRLGCSMAIVYKRRSAPGQIAEMKLIGEVTGKTTIVLDDIVDTAGTLCGASELLHDAGAEAVEAYITHPVLTGTSVSKLEASKFTKVFTTDSIVLNKYAQVSNKIEVISMAPIIARAIEEIHNE